MSQKDNTLQSEALNIVRDMDTTDIGSEESSLLGQATSILKKTFTPIKLIWRSDYFGTGKIGAFHYLGDYQGKKAVLKIQGAKPQISESITIEKFSAQNKSKLIRAPKILEVIPWDEHRGFEVIVFEDVSGNKVIDSKTLLQKDDISRFFSVYSEYKNNCIKDPWLPKPTENLHDVLQAKIEFAKKLNAQSPYTQDGDIDLAKEAFSVLEKVWEGIPLEFQHGHLSAEDLVYDENGQIVIFSNLFWKWKQPYYDAVFAYHWIIYGLSSVEGISPEQVDSQKKIWLDEMCSLPSVKTNRSKMLLEAAFLERAVAGLLVDSHAYISPENPIARYMVGASRAEVERLTRTLLQNDLK